MPMPTIEKERFRFRHMVYIIIAIVCMTSIGVAVYMQYFKDEKLGIIFGITSEENDKEISELKDNFLNLFTNDLTVIQGYSKDIKKIRNEEDIILLAYDIKEQGNNYTLDVEIPYFNINSETARKFNNEIKGLFKDKSDSIISSYREGSIVYNVRYRAYLYNNIVSLVILSELKEETANQRIIIQAYNYDLAENREVIIDDLITLKDIDVNNANNIISEEIKSSQEQNIKLVEMGYEVAVRDYNSDMYKINNAKEFFIGEKGYLYIVYAYGNTEHTSEMNVIILK